jgi:hypothetical protein
LARELECCKRSGQIGRKICVLGDSDHGEDLIEMGREPKCMDLLVGIGSLDQKLNYEGDSAGVDVIHLGEI